jgi:hypothetical protein
VQRIWPRPNRSDSNAIDTRASNDPDVEAQAADIIALYLDPRQHAAVFCVDEKTAIQALDRLDPVLLRCRRVGRNGMASSITARGRYRDMRLWM